MRNTPTPRKVSNVLNMLRDPKDKRAARILAACLLIWELVLCGLIILNVSYTEIDWKAYMEQVETFLKGERDYKEINGGTGPLVYPAGFLYVFSSIFWATNEGQIFLGQVIFAILYLVNIAIVFELYIRSESVPPWVLCLLTLSKRIHSIFVLRLFNDCIAMLFAHLALLLLTSSSIRGSILVFSTAVSIKMNVLLMAPPVFAIVITAGSFGDLLIGVTMGFVLQILLALPFLMHNPWSYLSRAFEFTRVFMYQWTVNWRFLPEEIFLGRTLAISLLIAHLLVLLLAGYFKWIRKMGGVENVINGFMSKLVSRKQVNPGFIIWMVFLGNFVGIVFARSLHYQFYSWYFFSIPYLLWHTNFPDFIKILLFLSIELSWNIFPATWWSSGLLLFSNSCLLLGLLTKQGPSIYLKERRQ